jgi:hypothetical protein
MYIISRTGLSRLMPESEIAINLPLMKSKDLTEVDKQRYLAVFYKSAFSKDMIREVTFLKNNAEIVAENEVPFDTPMYFFISTHQDANVPGWKETLSGYLSNIPAGKYMQLETGHYVHYEKAEIIAEEAKAFLEDIN